MIYPNVGRPILFKRGTVRHATGGFYHVRVRCRKARAVVVVYTVRVIMYLGTDNCFPPDEGQLSREDGECKFFSL